MDLTLVVAVDKRHNEELKHSLPTWLKHRPALRDARMVLAYDRDELKMRDVKWCYGPNVDLQPWPPANCQYKSQRHKMLSAFVFLSSLVDTDYWLKIDTDAIAFHCRSLFPDPAWFDDRPAIVSNPWGYTKPASLLMDTERWALGSKAFDGYEPLRLSPKDGSNIIRHKRIISWVMFTRTDFSRRIAESIETPWVMPVASQDTLFWYCATAWKETIRTVKFKQHGWEHWLTMPNIAGRAAVSMDEP